MTDASDVLAKFAPVARCSRRTWTKAKRGPKAFDWCSWCQAWGLRPTTPCPVAAIIARPRTEDK